MTNKLTFKQLVTVFLIACLPYLFMGAFKNTYNAILKKATHFGTEASSVTISKSGATTTVGGNLHVGGNIDDVQTNFSIDGDADSDAGGDTGDTLSFQLTPASNPHNGDWYITSSQGGIRVGKNLFSKWDGDVFIGDGAIQYDSSAQSITSLVMHNQNGDITNTSGNAVFDQGWVTSLAGLAAGNYSAISSGYTWTGTAPSSIVTSVSHPMMVTTGSGGAAYNVALLAMETNGLITKQGGTNFAVPDSVIQANVDSVILTFEPDLIVIAGLTVEFVAEGSNTGAFECTVDGTKDNG